MSVHALAPVDSVKRSGRRASTASQRCATRVRAARAGSQLKSTGHSYATSAEWCRQSQCRDGLRVRSTMVRRARPATASPRETPAPRVWQARSALRRRHLALASIVTQVPWSVFAAPDWSGQCGYAVAAGRDRLVGVRSGMALRGVRFVRSVGGERSRRQSRAWLHKPAPRRPRARAQAGPREGSPGAKGAA